MKHLWNSIKILSVIMVFSVLVSCSGSDGSGGSAGGESIYDPGASVPARGYSDSCPIELLIRDASGHFGAVHDGMYVQPGTRRLAVRVEGDQATIDRVFISDGGVYQVEALGEGDLYACDFDIRDTRLYNGVLVQVIHTDGRASKEKVVFRTTTEGMDEQLILDGIGMMVSQDLLDGSRDQVEEVIDGMLTAMFACIEDQDGGIISHVSYGDGNPGTVDIDIQTLEAVQVDAYPAAVLHIGLTVRDVDLSAVAIYGQDLVSTTNNDLEVDAHVALEDLLDDGTRGLVLNLLDSTAVSFTDDFFLRPVVEDAISSGLTVIEQLPLAADIQELADAIGSRMPMTVTIGDTEVDLDELFGNLELDLDRYLFVDVYGLPEETSANALALGAGLLATDYEEAGSPDGGGSAAPAVDPEAAFMDMFSAMVDEAFAEIKDDYDGLVTTLSYGDGNPDTDDIAIDSLSFQGSGTANTKTVRARFTISDVDLRAISLFGISLITTKNNDLAIDVTCRLTYRRTGGVDEVLLDVLSVDDVDFDERFLGDCVVEDLVARDIEDLDTFAIAIDDMLDGIDPDFDLSGCSGQGPLFPEVLEAYSPYMWDLGLSQEDTLSIALSQDMVNGILAQVFEPGFEWDVYEILRPLLGEDFAGFQAERKEGEETIMHLSVPPVVDLRTDLIRMELDDVVLAYRLDGQARWEASLDLDLILTAQVLGDDLAFYLSTVPENCHFHIMRDNPGNLGVFDHSNLVNDVVEKLPELVGNAPGGPLFTIGLDSIDQFLVLKDTADPVRIRAYQGYLYLDAAASRADLSWLMDAFSR